MRAARATSGSLGSCGALDICSMEQGTWTCIPHAQADACAGTTSSQQQAVSMTCNNHHWADVKPFFIFVVVSCPI